MAKVKDGSVTIALNLVNKSTGAVNSALGAVSGIVGGGASTAGSSLGNALGGALSSLGPQGAAVGEAVKGIGMLTDSMINLAKAANPAGYEMLEQVFKDLEAVVGRMFAPLLQRVTDLWRGIADALDAVLPSWDDMEQIFKLLDPIIAGVVGAIKEFAFAFKDIINLFLIPLQALASLLPDLETLNDIFQLLNPLIYITTQSLKLLASALHELVKFVSWLTGKKGYQGGTGSSIGAAPGQASYVGTAALGDQLRAKAFSQVGADPASRTAVATEKIAANTAVTAAAADPNATGRAITGVKGG